MTRKNRTRPKGAPEHLSDASGQSPDPAAAKLPSMPEAADQPWGIADLTEEAATLREVNECLVIATIHAQTMTEVAERATAQMRESAKRLALAMEVARLDFWDVELPTGRVVGHEKRFASLGYEPGEIKPRLDAWMQLIHPGDLPRLEQALQGQLAGECPAFRVEVRHRTKSGEWSWILTQAEAIERDGQGRPLRLIGVTEDITGRKLLEDDLRQANEKLENRIEARTSELKHKNEALEGSNLQLQQFAYIAAHDLQTPMRSIMGFSQLLYKDYHGQLDAQADEWLENLMAASRRMHELIRDVLAYSRIDSRGNAMQPTDVGRLFDEVVKVMAEQLAESGAQVTRGPLPVVMGDPSQLAQVLQNLIDNAIKYHGTDPLRVHVSAERRGQGWLFSVRDNGIGIADKHREDIFDIFCRLHSLQAYPGTGIGLAVCRRVVDRHGGRIWVESEPGHGSAFYFTLPDQRQGAS